MTRNDATYLLDCRHCVSTNNCRDYSMYCIVIGETKSGKAKILLFGERNWKLGIRGLKGNIKLSIKYVDFSRLMELGGYEI